ncbi:MAG: DEAD/DEAH box helicase [Zoogloeaceae bacterium]|jgi:ATP-dependent RNA helicase RhlE|nr:DEAD/DEAH box helicase [Zoogloeaceae bacterium]
MNEPTSESASDNTAAFVAPTADAPVTTAFSDLGLAPELLKAVVDSGYTIPTPIQVKAIPLVLAGRDIMGGAQTGTGKTAAFTLPILQRMLPFASSSPSPARHPVRALILAPTRELALQVFESVRSYSKYTPLRAMCAFGGVDIRPQTAELKRGVEILVATPGRLLDHVEQKSVHFNAVQALVLDEADRMLDMGFIPDIKRILAMLPVARQSLLFSATFSDDIKRLADSMLKAPTLVEVARRNQVSETILHRVYPVAEHDKRALLTRLLKSGEISQSIVFTRTKQGCSRLARELLRAGIQADAIHGDKSQHERIKVLDDFKNGQVAVLVATDVAARGLDIEELPYVINYELPHVPEDYVHRIGRTGRAGRQGKAISLVSAAEKIYLADIEKLLKKPIEQVILPGFEPESGHEDAAAQRGKRAVGAPVRAPVAAPRANDRESRSPKKRMIAADGFDFSKPYEPRGEIPTDAKAPPRQPVRQAQKIVAALLGGLGRTEE